MVFLRAQMSKLLYGSHSNVKLLFGKSTVLPKTRAAQTLTILVLQYTLCKQCSNHACVSSYGAYIFLHSVTIREAEGLHGALKPQP